MSDINWQTRKKTRGKYLGETKPPTQPDITLSDWMPKGKAGSFTPQSRNDSFHNT